MFSLSPSFGVGGVWIEHLTHSRSHPLDIFVDGIRALSEEAFRGVHEATGGDLISFAFSMVNDARTAEDIVQDTFVELVGAAARLRGNGAALRAWLFKSVRYGCLDEYRRRARHPERPTPAVPDHPTDPPRDLTLDPRLAGALSKLSKRHRTLLALKHVVGLEGEETARIMGMTRKAVYSATERAETKLRRVWEDWDE